MSKVGVVSAKNRKNSNRLKERMDERSRTIQQSKQWEKDYNPLKSSRLRKKKNKNG